MSAVGVTDGRNVRRKTSDGASPARELGCEGAVTDDLYHPGAIAPGVVPKRESFSRRLRDVLLQTAAPHLPLAPSPSPYTAAAPPFGYKYEGEPTTTGPWLSPSSGNASSFPGFSAPRYTNATSLIQRPAAPSYGNCYTSYNDPPLTHGLAASSYGSYGTAPFLPYVSATRRNNYTAPTLTRGPAAPNYGSYSTGSQVSALNCAAPPLTRGPAAPSAIHGALDVDSRIERWPLPVVVQSVDDSSATTLRVADPNFPIITLGVDWRRNLPLAVCLGKFEHDNQMLKALAGAQQLLNVWDGSEVWATLQRMTLVKLHETVGYVWALGQKEEITIGKYNLAFFLTALAALPPNTCKLSCYIAFRLQPFNKLFQRGCILFVALSFAKLKNDELRCKIAANLVTKPENLRKLMALQTTYRFKTLVGEVAVQLNELDPWLAGQGQESSLVGMMGEVLQNSSHARGQQSIKQLATDELLVLRDEGEKTIPWLLQESQEPAGATPT